ncbi:unnamed protein product, partial [Nesidiocoris tenuis]
MHRSPDPSAFPRPPSAPRLLNATQSSLTVAWDPPPGASTLIGYTLEYYSPDLQTGWVVAAHRVSGHSLVVVLKSNNSLSETHLNGTSPSLLLTRLSPQIGYSVRVCGYTRAGQGPWSPDVPVTTAEPTSRPRAYNPSTPTWLLVVTAGSALVLGITCTLALYLRRRQLTKELGHLS